MDQDTIITSGPHSPYTSVHTYSRLSSRPAPYGQTIISPPRLVNDGPVPILNLTTKSIPSYPLESFGDPALMHAIAELHGLKFNSTHFAWEYDKRRDAQPVLPFLYLGPNTVARDSTFVRENQISLMIAVRNATAAQRQPAFLDPSRFPSAHGLQTLVVDLDTPFDLIRHLRATVKAINEHLRQSCSGWPISSLEDIRGRVLIFCESGNDRSAVVVAAYLMVLFGLDPVSAFQVVIAVRFCVQSNTEMMLMLSDFYATLQAERDVIISREDNIMGDGGLKQENITRSPLKRNHRMLDSEAEMQNVDHNECTGLSGGRLGVAPFSDTRNG